MHNVVTVKLDKLQSQCYFDVLTGLTVTTQSLTPGKRTLLVLLHGYISEGERRCGQGGVQGML